MIRRVLVFAVLFIPGFWIIGSIFFNFMASTPPWRIVLGYVGIIFWLIFSYVMARKYTPRRD